MRIEFAAMLSAGAVFVSSAALAESDHLAATEYDFDHVSCTGAKNEIRVIITDVKESVGLVTVDLSARQRTAGAGAVRRQIADDENLPESPGKRRLRHVGLP